MPSQKGFKSLNFPLLSHFIYGARSSYDFIWFNLHTFKCTCIMHIRKLTRQYIAHALINAYAPISTNEGKVFVVPLYECVIFHMRVYAQVYVHVEGIQCTQNLLIIFIMFTIHRAPVLNRVSLDLHGERCFLWYDERRI